MHPDLWNAEEMLYFLYFMLFFPSIGAYVKAHATYFYLPLFSQ